LSQQAVIAEAQLLAAEQRERIETKQGALAAALVVKRLQQATRRRDAARVMPRAVEYTIRSASGAVLARGTRPQRGSNLMISVPRSATADRAAVMQAIQDVLDRLTEA
jgi:hypothetical protein